MKKIVLNFILEAIWFIILTSILVLIGIIIMHSRKGQWELDDTKKVILSSIRDDKVLDCCEKLGAYGEGISFNNIKYTDAYLKKCLNKLKDYE